MKPSRPNGRASFRSRGESGRNAAALTRHAHNTATDWDRRIAQWQDETSERIGPEPHRAGVAINESYFLVDGLTVATSAKGSPSGRPHFGLIECHDYALYNTMDLWIYAAEAVARFFPDLNMRPMAAWWVDVSGCHNMSERQDLKLE